MTRAMTANKRIAILTGGGDVPGLNAVIKSVVYRATDAGYEVLGIRRGWEGLTHLRPKPVTGPRLPAAARPHRTRATIDRTGGTILHTSRTNPRKMRAAGLPAWLDDAERARYDGERRGLRPDPAGPRQPVGARRRRAGDDRRRRHAVLLAGPGERRRRRWSRSPRPWTTTSRGPSTASASRRRSRGPRRRSTGSGRRSAATSGSASSGSSGAMPGSRRCTRPMSRPPAA